MSDGRLNDRALYVFEQMTGTRTPPPEKVAEIPEEEWLRRIPNCGPKTAAHIKEWLASKGLAFKHPYQPPNQDAKIKKATALLLSLGYKVTPPE